jgi:hypothetical protein
MLQLRFDYQLAFIWFSFPRDYGKLAESIQSVKTLEPRAAFFVAVDSAHEPPPIEGVEIIRTDFQRGTHLDGKSATLGVAETLESLAAAETIVKVDSDTVILKQFWKSGPVVFQRMNKSFCGIYAIPGIVAEGLVEKVQSERFRHHEGNAICGIARKAWTRCEPYEDHHGKSFVFI